MKKEKDYYLFAGENTQFICKGSLDECVDRAKLLIYDNLPINTDYGNNLGCFVIMHNGVKVKGGWFDDCIVQFR